MDLPETPQLSPHTHIKLRRFEDRILTRMGVPERKDRIIE
jgi:tRNA A37 methylthiotransferase MiaB